MGSEFLLQKLNEKQKEAVVTTEGPVLVIAGAGSGKTRALTHRIAYLINEHDIPPENILAVTFTNKAAGEMRDRIIKLLGGEGNVHPSQLPTIGTFHSVCVRILRRHIHLLDFENQFTIYDTSDQQVLMKHIFEEQRINPKELNPRAVLAHISNAKNRLITPAAFEAQATSYFESKVARLYGPYQEGLKKNNAVDFDDILMRTVELFKKHPEVLKEYQERWYYVHVDEYQDTNQAQYLLTNLLAARHRNLYVIGDHDQSIYSWRGANIQNILDFEKDYPEAKIITLEQNYRSTQPILDIAQAVISKNRKRREKTLWTERTEGAKAELYLAENERHEAEVIGQKILDAVRQHEQPDYRDFVVLYRTNAQSRAMEEGFMRMGIPYKIIGGIRFYERKEIKDMISYLRVVSNPADTVALLRIINTPQRKIGPKTVERIQTFAAIKFCSFYEAMRRAEEIEELTGPKKEQVLRFARLIDRLRSRSREVTASAMIKYTLDESGYKKSLDDGSVEGEARLENIAELISVSSKYDKLAPGLSLNIFLEEVSLIADIDSLDEKDNSATLMTMHGAKGLEFPWVFIAGLEEGILPHSRSMLSPEELEEERRLFYVACTRAEERLFLFYTKNRMFYGETKDAIPSQFLRDIPEDLIISNVNASHERTAAGWGFSRPQGSIYSSDSAADETFRKDIPDESSLPSFSDGDRVIHRKFGEGVILNSVGGVVTVSFKDPTIGVKKLAVSVAPLEKI